MTRLWIVHWVSALLLIFLLMTSLPIAILEWLRPSPRSWMTIHMTAGWTLTIITAYRLAASTYLSRFRTFLSSRNASSRTISRYVLLVLAVVVLMAGLVIYRPSPLAKPVYLFGFFAAPPLVNLPHEAHLQAIALHRYGRYVLVALLALHAFQAFFRTSPSGQLPIAWLWNRHSSS